MKVAILVTMTTQLTLELSNILGFLLKKSAKTNGWSKRWFVLNEKTGKVCVVLFYNFH